VVGHGRRATGDVKRAEEYPEGNFRRGAAQTVREIAVAKHMKPGRIASASPAKRRASATAGALYLIRCG
jgi:hypothetical protein